MLFGDQGQEPGGLGPAARAAPAPRAARRRGDPAGRPEPARTVRAWSPGQRRGPGGRRGGRGRPGTPRPPRRGTRPGWTPGPWLSRSSHSTSPPITARRVTSPARSGGVLVAGDDPGADDADQRVAGQRVGGRGHRPHRQVPPARRGRDHVHEHARPGRGHVQRPGPDRPAAVQRQRDAQAGEHQRGGVGDRGLQAGHHRQVPGRVRPGGTGRRSSPRPRPRPGRSSPAAAAYSQRPGRSRPGPRRAGAAAATVPAAAASAQRGRCLAGQRDRDNRCHCQAFLNVW